jgi:hypothetical protein
MDRAVLFAGITAVALLAKIATNRMIISKNKAIPLLVNALQNHRDAAPIQKAVFKALFRISANKMIRENLIQKPVIQEIVEVMKYHNSNIPVQRSAIICLLQFAKHPPLRTVIQQEAVSHIVMAHNKFNDVVHFQKVSSKAVQLLVITNNPAPADINLLANQEKEMKDKVQEKEKLIDVLNEKKNILDVELEALKELKEIQEPSKEEILSKAKKEFSKLLQQRETLLDDIKKGETQNKSAALELEVLKSKLEEKKQFLSNKKPERIPEVEPEKIEETPPKKKTISKNYLVLKKRGNTPREKGMEKNISAPAIIKSEKENKSNTGAKS